MTSLTMLSAALLLPTGRVQHLLCLVLLSGLALFVFIVVRSFLRNVGMAARPRPGRVVRVAAAMGAALYVAMEGLSAWLGLATPAKLMVTLLLAAIVTRYMQIDFGYLWITDPNLPLSAAPSAHPPIWHP